MTLESKLFAGMRKTPNAIMLALPYPPSINHMFQQHNGARISKAYREWRDHAGWALKEQRPPKMPGPVSIEVTLTPPDKRMRDLDNVGFKAICDLLVAHEIIEADDSRIVRRIAAEWVDGDPCTVTVKSIEVLKHKQG